MLNLPDSLCSPLFSSKLCGCVCKRLCLRVSAAPVCGLRCDCVCAHLSGWKCMVSMCMRVCDVCACGCVCLVHLGVCVHVLCRGRGSEHSQRYGNGWDPSMLSEFSLVCAAPWPGGCLSGLWSKVVLVLTGGDQFLCSGKLLAQPQCLWTKLPRAAPPRP